MSGVTNSQRIVAAKAHVPEDRADQKMPRAATRLASIVSSATWPDASKPMRLPVA